MRRAKFAVECPIENEEEQGSPSKEANEFELEIEEVPRHREETK